MKLLITETVVLDFYKRGLYSIPVSKQDIITALALDTAKKKGVVFVEKGEGAHEQQAQSLLIKHNPQIKSVSIGCDHTGFAAKQEVIVYLKSLGFNIIDEGSYSEQSCDFPDYANKVAQRVVSGEVSFGIMLDATGTASGMVVNKVKGIRGAVCYNEFSARSAREHNNANVITLGAKTLGIELIKSTIKTFIDTGFGGGRHKRRVEKIMLTELK